MGIALTETKNVYTTEYKSVKRGVKFLAVTPFSFLVIFENFVKSMTSCLSKLKVTPSFCFAFKIPDNPTATRSMYYV